ncbi:MAG: type II CAAX endopeptidase family protein [Syntrophomonas sp.]|nr:type II CAAX endopeptidase family protein [Syntrophomonas sp.]
MTERPHWGFIDIILVYLGVMVVGILTSMLGKNIPGLLPGHLGSGEMGYFLTGFLVQFLATVGFVYLFAVFLPRGQWKDLGINKARPGSYSRYGIIGGILLIMMVLVIGYVLKYLQPDLQPQYYEEMLRSVTRIPDFIVILVVGAILAPLSEELFYRGMIYPVFRKYLGPMWGAILAGLVFGLAHWDLWRTIPLALGGMGLCYIYEKSGSILVSAVAHGVWNGVMSILIYISLSRGML